MNPVAQEQSEIWLVELGNEYIQKDQKEDEKEDIQPPEWFDLDNLDINKLHSTAPNKLALMMVREYYQKEKEIKEHDENENSI